MDTETDVLHIHFSNTCWATATFLMLLQLTVPSSARFSFMFWPFSKFFFSDALLAACTIRTCTVWDCCWSFYLWPDRINLWLFSKKGVPSIPVRLIWPQCFMFSCVREKFIWRWILIVSDRLSFRLDARWINIISSWRTLSGQAGYRT